MPLPLSPLPPWLLLAGLLGAINGAACFMLVGREISRLAWYALVGLFAASLGQVVGSALHTPNPLSIGDVNVLAVSVSACSLVLVARVFARF